MDPADRAKATKKQRVIYIRPRVWSVVVIVPFSKDRLRYIKSGSWKAAPLKKGFE